MNPVLFSSRYEDWGTPQALFDELNREFKFTLDAAATKESAKVSRFISKERATPSLGDWGYCSVVFLNPPYGRDIGRWMEKAYRESQRGLVVCLVHARTDTRWFHDWVLGKAEIRFLKGRLKFTDYRPDPDGKPRKPQSSTFPSIVVIYRPPTT